ncbi:tyrosine-type recombinase/integrase [Ferrimonas balearica]|uniref:tyrosine-type recombinase/integrase n=1 Tax=Ferrimonas balearica TaxID=44012 RepID=UPI001FEFA6FE|nr:tyrosine-type recombinase/integrase [Ferrimonas balearica]
MAEIWTAYQDAVAEHETRYTLATLVNEYQASAAYAELAPRSREDKDGQYIRLLKVFGKMVPDAVKPQHVRKYLDIRGQKSKVQANHELSALSTAYRWGYERGKVAGNPCQGVKKFPTKDRDRYITDAEYQAMLTAAEVRLVIAMEISYLCAARQGDVLDLKWSQIQDDGIFIRQGKTGKKQIKAWTPRLQAAIESARQLQSACASIYVINSARGGRLSKSGLQSAWRRALDKLERQNAADPQSAIELTFTFHDIKAKGISDYEGTVAEKQRFSGHKTQRQVGTYDRKTEVVRTLDR